jgi:hypothetical protein
MVKSLSQAVFCSLLNSVLVCNEAVGEHTVVLVIAWGGGRSKPLSKTSVSVLEE